MNSPFNEAKYKTLLEGLEVKETLFTKTISNKDFRIDSQFYTKEPIKNSKLEYDKIGNLLKNAQYGISISMNEERDGYPIYRMNEIHNMLCDIDVSKYAKITNEEREIFKLNDREVLFNRTNSFEWVGRTGLYRKIDNKDFVFASYLVRFIPDEEKLLPEYLTAFLNTKYGIWDIKRRARQSINQTNVNPEEVKEIEIPLLSNDFQKSIKSFFDVAHTKRVKSLSIYTQAEDILLEELGLKDFEPSNEPVNIKSFKESFLSTGRLDAEYYQKKYEDYLNLIYNYKNGYSHIKKEFQLERNIIDRTEKFYNYTEIGDVNISDGIISYKKISVEDLPANGKMKLEKDNIIISKVRPYRGAVGIIRDVPENYVGSGAFTVLSEKTSYKKEVLKVLLRLSIYKDLMMKYNVGSSYPVIKDEDILNIPIPFIDDTKQQQIAELIEDSFALKKQSEELLETAKRAVEIAIEENEEKAAE